MHSVVKILPVTLLMIIMRVKRAGIKLLLLILTIGIYYSILRNTPFGLWKQQPIFILIVIILISVFFDLGFDWVIRIIGLIFQSGGIMLLIAGGCIILVANMLLLIFVVALSQPVVRLIFGNAGPLLLNRSGFLITVFIPVLINENINSLSHTSYLNLLS